jgi:hypothetical protein
MYLTRKVNIKRFAVKIEDFNIALFAVRSICLTKITFLLVGLSGISKHDHGHL